MKTKRPGKLTYKFDIDVDQELVGMMIEAITLAAPVLAVCANKVEYHDTLIDRALSRNLAVIAKLRFYERFEYGDDDEKDI